MYRLYVYYPSRIPVYNSTEYFSENLQNSTFSNGGDGRSAMTQSNCCIMFNSRYYLLIFLFV